VPDDRKTPDVSVIRLSSNKEDLMEALASFSFPVSSRRKNMFPYFNAIRETSELSDLQGLVIYQNHAPAAVILGSTSAHKGDGEFSYFGTYARLEVASDFQNDITSNVLRRISKELLGFLGGRGAQIELKMRNSVETRLLHSLLIEASSHQVTFEAISKPELGAEAILKAIRSGHRESVRKGLQNFHEGVDVHYGSLEPHVADSFQRLHVHAAGRVTRPERSWEEMFTAIKAKNAMLVTAQFEGELVGATFSWLGPNDALYGTGAYNRELFHVFPISHALLFRSIEKAGDLGLHEFVLGDPFALAGNQKEKGIASFKMGFAIEIHEVHQIRLG